MTFDDNFDIDKEAAALFADSGDWVVAMAYVPDSKWADLYDEELAFQKGTLFAELDKPFLGRKQVQYAKR